MNNFSKDIFCFIHATLDRYKLPVNDSVIHLLMMIMAHESGNLRYVKQKNGPALGLLQMEPNTFDFVMEYLERKRKFTMVERIHSAEMMALDSSFAIAVARVYLWTFAEPLPTADDYEGLARYAKKYWNTTAGAATEEDYLNAFLKMKACE